MTRLSLRHFHDSVRPSTALGMKPRTPELRRKNPMLSSSSLQWVRWTKAHTHTHTGCRCAGLWHRVVTFRKNLLLRSSAENAIIIRQFLFSSSHHSHTAVACDNNEPHRDKNHLTLKDADTWLHVRRAALSLDGTITGDGWQLIIGPSDRGDPQHCHIYHYLDDIFPAQPITLSRTVTEWTEQCLTSKRPRIKIHAGVEEINMN